MKNQSKDCSYQWTLNDWSYFSGLIDLPLNQDPQKNN
jgi:hypothetical protein